ncbi:hypothetical protein BJF92_21665 [Rhizobium rhizosphaerae]|uniref:Uncharacterized protein n=1 Tax=Xaviernesmea rhizosphaerae TaxID=1672749 RepID=A0A1Q9AQS9_9HYPH|nr:hypothetical protein [Xaviernesmea rhizosphaerae]OLP57665.1 hypothetical protein BJF92_21665 [Xaviernesmea rhizosphaerae]
MKNIALLALLLFLAAIGLFLAVVWNGYEWHQKLTVTVDTPNGPLSASSVQQMRLSDKRGPWNPPEGSGVSFTLSGEAVVMELSQGRYLFALLSGTPSLGEQLYPKMDVIDAAKLLERGEAEAYRSVTLSRRDHPLLVTFGDINDPASVERVDPANLEASFGPGYRLQSMTLALTEEPVTKGKVKKVLLWLGPYPEPTLSPATGDISNIPFSSKVAQGDFIRGKR